jgi:hypothetical protein
MSKLIFYFASTNKVFLKVSGSKLAAAVPFMQL